MKKKKVKRFVQKAPQDAWSTWRRKRLIGDGEDLGAILILDEHSP